MDTFEIFWQRDPRWRDQRIGKSSETIGSAGCLITCIAMMVGERPDEVERTLYRAGKIGRPGCSACLNTFALDDIWPTLHLADVSKRWPGPVPQADLDRLSAHLHSDQPALIEVDIDLRTGPLNQHFVLAPGERALLGPPGTTLMVHDPWWGDVADIVPRYGRDLARAVWRYILYKI